MKRSHNLGLFQARALSAKLGTAGKMTHVEVDIELHSTGEKVKWRGGFTPAAINKTMCCLLAMGTTFVDNNPLDFKVGSGSFWVELVKVDCDTDETHGKEGVARLFVRDVRQA